MRAEVRREIARLMGHTRRYCQMAVNKRLSVIGSSLHEYSVLFRLIDEDEVPQHEIAFDAAIDPAAASRLVRDMAQQGLLTTRVDPADKRQRYIRITPKGRTLEKALTPVVDSAIEPYMVGLTPDEEEHFLALLQKAHTAIVTLMEQGELGDSRPAAAQEKPREVAQKRAAAAKRAAPLANQRGARTPARPASASPRAATVKARLRGGR